MSATSALTNASALLDRVPVRERGASLTRSAWRVAVTADEGSGTIVRLEASDGAVHFRGDGLFLGWGAVEMGAAWDALARSDAPPEPEFMQLG
ncbi:MAG TPA: hypothetical protein VLJ18_02215 [Thermoanaerobaculia bacterium]|nr:hypothetical protein [Thermoanaerobaculia bacterium]